MCNLSVRVLLSDRTLYHKIGFLAMKIFALYAINDPLAERGSLVLPLKATVFEVLCQHISAVVSFAVALDFCQAVGFIGGRVAIHNYIIGAIGIDIACNGFVFINVVACVGGVDKPVF